MAETPQKLRASTTIGPPSKMRPESMKENISPEIFLKSFPYSSNKPCSQLVGAVFHDDCDPDRGVQVVTNHIIVGIDISQPLGKTLSPSFACNLVREGWLQDIAQYAKLPCVNFWSKLEILHSPRLTSMARPDSFEQCVIHVVW